MQGHVDHEDHQNTKTYSPFIQIDIYFKLENETTTEVPAPLVLDTLAFSFFAKALMIRVPKPCSPEELLVEIPMPLSITAN